MVIEYLMNKVFSTSQESADVCCVELSRVKTILTELVAESADKNRTYRLKK